MCVMFSEDGRSSTQVFAPLLFGYFTGTFSLAGSETRPEVEKADVLLEEFNNAWMPGRELEMTLEFVVSTIRMPIFAR